MNFIFALLLLSQAGYDPNAITQSQEPTLVGPTVKFPEPPGPTPAPPIPSPSSVPNLLPGTMYVVTSDVPIDLRPSPQGLVAVTPETGPVVLYAVFFDGNGEIERRNYPQKYVYVVKSATKTSVGRVELLAIPFGFSKDADITSRLLDVSPVPAPVPPAPVPVPPAPTDPLTILFQNAYNLDGKDASSLAFLQGAYKGMAASLKPGMATNLDAYNWLKSVVNAPGVGLTPTALTNLRKAIGAELTVVMTPAPNAPLDQAKFQAELGKISSALAGVK